MKEQTERWARDLNLDTNFHTLTHTFWKPAGEWNAQKYVSKIHDWKDTGHGIHPAGDASEHVSLVREVLLCGYCNAAGEEERDREDETGPFTNIITRI